MVIIEITDEQHEAGLKWWRKHAEKCEWASGRKYAGAIGGVLTWTRTDTSIGPIISINCTCKAAYCVNGLDL